MAALDQLGIRPPDQSSAGTAAANAQVQVTLAARPGYRWVVCGYTMSTDGNVAATITPDIVSGSVVVDRFKAPAALPVDRVIEFTRGFMCPINTSVVATLPAAGASVIGNIVLRAYEVSDR
jgi:hypothetical protein